MEDLADHRRRQITSCFFAGHTADWSRQKDGWSRAPARAAIPRRTRNRRVAVRGAARSSSSKRTRTRRPALGAASGCRSDSRELVNRREAAADRRVETRTAVVFDVAASRRIEHGGAVRGPGVVSRPSASETRRGRREQGGDKSERFSELPAPCRTRRPVAASVGHESVLLPPVGGVWPEAGARLWRGLAAACAAESRALPATLVHAAD